MKSPIPIIFAGSFQHYSTYIAKDLYDHPDFDLKAIISTPPMPVGRKKVLTSTDTHQWADAQGIPTLTPKDLNGDLNQLLKKVSLTTKDIAVFLTAGYGKLVPSSWLDAFPHSLNLHFSLLPRYRGANPAEWAILLGEKDTGVTLINMSSEFDTGDIIAKSSISIDPMDTRVSLYENLYNLGADVVPTMISSLLEWTTEHPDALAPAIPQPVSSPTPEALRFSRAHGYIDWHNITSAMSGKSITLSSLNARLSTAARALDLKNANPLQHAMFIERAIRALYDYPGVWTYIPTKDGKKRLKIHTASIYKNVLKLDSVQLEGKDRSTFNQIKSIIHEDHQ